MSATERGGAAERAKGVALDTHEKALAMNLDATSFGSFAEIRAGQEVARCFCGWVGRKANEGGRVTPTHET